MARKTSGRMATSEAGRQGGNAGQQRPVRSSGRHVHGLRWYVQPSLNSAVSLNESLATPRSTPPQPAAGCTHQTG